MTATTFKAAITAKNTDVLDGEFACIFNSIEVRGTIALADGSPLNKGKTGDAIITLNEATSMAVNERFACGRPPGALETAGEVIDIVE